ncbi:MAG: SRPBCC family protein [bacterium]|nr:MAG: SRPBCC family protein [bacterium]
MKTFYFEKDIYIERPVSEVFDFFSRAENLEKVTPSQLQFQILTPLPIIMKAGTIIDYKLKLHRIPLSWKTEISEWDPPHRFTDIQVKGPYRKWIHQHIFENSGSGTRMKDMLEYAIPAGFLSSFINQLLVRKDIESIFRYREKKYREIFQIPTDHQ